MQKISTLKSRIMNPPWQLRFQDLADDEWAFVEGRLAALEWRVSAPTSPRRLAAVSAMLTSGFQATSILLDRLLSNGSLTSENFRSSQEALMALPLLVRSSSSTLTTLDIGYASHPCLACFEIVFMYVYW
jgi:hypothetical protein